jgi:hypothetical protein
MQRTIPHVLPAALALLLTAGCGGEPRYEVSGTVTFDGVAVERGEISFDPVDPGRAPEGGPIEGGRFAVEMTAGKKIVRIRGSRKLPPERQDNPEMGPLYEDYIPAAHNTESTRQVEITPGGDNEFTFDLTSK